MILPPLPRWSKPTPGFTPGTLAWRTLLLGTAAFVLAFLCGFLLAFPVAPLKQWLVDGFKRHGATVEIATLQLSPRLVLEGERMSIRIDHSGLPPLMVERFSLRPLWLSLLGAEPGARVAAELLEGTLQAEVYAGGRVQAQASGLRFSLPVGDGAATVSGTLAAGHLQRSGGDGPSATHTFSLVFGDLLVTTPLLAGMAGHPLALGEVTVEASGRGPSYSITRLESRGGDLSLSGSGTVLAGSSLENSRLNLTLKLRPAATIPAALRGLFDLMAPPAGDGSYQLKIVGTLAQPRLLHHGSEQGSVAASANRDGRNHASPPADE